MPIPNKHLGCGRFRFFVEKDGTHGTKMGADSLAENNPKVSEFISSICMPKALDINEKRLHWTSVVR